MVLANDKLFLTFKLTPNSLHFQLTPTDSPKHFIGEEASQRNCHLFHIILLHMLTSTIIFPNVLEKELLYIMGAKLLTSLRPHPVKIDLSVPHGPLKVKRDELDAQYLVHLQIILF